MCIATIRERDSPTFFGSHSCCGASDLRRRFGKASFGDFLHPPPPNPHPQNTFGHETPSAFLGPSITISGHSYAIGSSYFRGSETLFLRCSTPTLGHSSSALSPSESEIPRLRGRLRSAARSLRSLRCIFRMQLHVGGRCRQHPRSRARITIPPKMFVSHALRTCFRITFRRVAVDFP